MGNIIAVALSGGVDSLVAAYILRTYELPLIAINFITGFETDPSILSAKTKFKDISDRLKIPVEVVNLKKEFKSNIVDYFVKTYCEGKTPNPCIVCNYKIKFGLLMDIAKKLGASKIATGHYARIETHSNGTLNLKKGKDPFKDQSYFLSRLTHNQLNRAIFPIGNMMKTQVKLIASENGLQPITREESQDICFIKTQKYGDFIKKIVEFPPEPGEIIDTDGKKLGIHKGLQHFTIGQRRGINCPSKKPYYVIQIDKTSNCLIVGEKRFLYSSRCSVKNINWMLISPKKPIQVNVKIRYNHPASPATLVPIGKNSAIIKFDKPQLAIAPGQEAVFYIDCKIIGSGYIERI